MDKERMLKLADHIESLKPKRFHMGFWAARDIGTRDEITLIGADELVGERKCNTAGCIAGWAVALFAPEYKGVAIASKAGLLLDLNWAEKDNLFNGLWGTHIKPLNEITKEEAAAQLRKLTAAD